MKTNCQFYDFLVFLGIKMRRPPRLKSSVFIYQFKFIHCMNEVPWAGVPIIRSIWYSLGAIHELCPCLTLPILQANKNSWCACVKKLVCLRSGHHTLLLACFSIIIEIWTFENIKNEFGYQAFKIQVSRLYCIIQ